MPEGPQKEEMIKQYRENLRNQQRKTLVGRNE